MSIRDAVRLAKARAVPILGITTPDQIATLHEIVKAMESLKDQMGDYHLFDWDVSNGLRMIGEGVHPLTSDPEALKASADPHTLLRSMAPRLQENDILVMRGAHNILRMSEVIPQAISNLRDPFKNNARMLILLGPVLPLPPELANDVLLEDEPLPDRFEIESVMKQVVKDESIKWRDEDERERVVDAVQGLTKFAAEQVLYLGRTSENGMNFFDLGRLWSRKKAFIRQTPGLSISDATHTYEDIGGLEWAKAYFRRELKGKEPPKVVCFIDEIEKALAGFKGDNTGVTQDQMTMLLTHMSKRKAQGAIFIGAPGASKTFFAEATGNEAGIPTINIDFGAMKSSRVGDSEQAMRMGLKMMDAVANSNQLFLGSCNSLGDLPPELQRRFTLGVLFFDVPSKSEQLPIWKIKMTQKGMKFDEALLPDSAGWTGAQIEHCVNSAWRYDISLKEAAKDIVPYAVTGSRQLLALRELAQANGFKDASTGERYQMPKGGDGRKTMEV
jgi:hypothetical protein